MSALIETQTDVRMMMNCEEVWKAINTVFTFTYNCRYLPAELKNTTKNSVKTEIKY
jgi:hypothetical protein